MKQINLSGNDSETIITTIKAIASDTRYKILKLLVDNEMDITRIAEALGQTEANISSQIKILGEANLIESKYEPGVHGVRKICTTSVSKITVTINDDNDQVDATEELNSDNRF